MKKEKALKVILALAIGGMLFAGYLSYPKVFGDGACEVTKVTCGTELYIFGLPACVYGFFMYTTIAVISYCGLKSKK